MNKVILMGRLTSDPDIRYTPDNKIIARYSLAVDRRQTNQDGSRSADFIGCVAFGNSAEFSRKYLQKGTKIAVVGHIQTGSYTNRDGQKIYTTDVIVEEQEFAESKAASDQRQAQTNSQTNYQPQQTNYQPHQSQYYKDSRDPMQAPQYQQQMPNSQPVQYHQQTLGEGFMSIPDGVDAPSLPFN